jgi:hypothetical protein
MSIEPGSGSTHSDMGMARGGGIVRCRDCSWAVVGLAMLNCQYERTRSIVRGWGRFKKIGEGLSTPPVKQEKVTKQLRR